MIIYVNCHSLNRIITVEVPETATTNLLIEEIAKACKVDLSCGGIWVFFKGNQLRNGEYLSQYNICNRSKVVAVVKLAEDITLRSASVTKLNELMSNRELTTTDIHFKNMERSVQDEYSGSLEQLRQIDQSLDLREWTRKGYINMTRQYNEWMEYQEKMTPRKPQRITVIPQKKLDSPSIESLPSFGP